jgi:hypothetical protein
MLEVELVQNCFSTFTFPAENALDFSLGAHINANCRFIKDEHLGPQHVRSGATELAVSHQVHFEKQLHSHLSVD